VWWIKPNTIWTHPIPPVPNLHALPNHALCYHESQPLLLRSLPLECPFTFRPVTPHLSKPNWGLLWFSSLSKNERLPVSPFSNHTAFYSESKLVCVYLPWQTRSPLRVGAKQVNYCAFQAWNLVCYREDTRKRFAELFYSEKHTSFSKT
jgi:hypothetical protein